jgi:hypothetical protein
MRQIVIAMVVVMMMVALASAAQAGTLVKPLPTDTSVGQALTLDVTPLAAVVHHADGSTVTAGLASVKLDGEDKLATRLAAKGGAKKIAATVLRVGRAYVEKPMNGEATRGYVGAGVSGKIGPVSTEFGAVVSVKNLHDAGWFVAAAVPISL